MRPSSSGISVVAFSGRRVWSRVIRLRSRSQFSHVGLVCEIDGDDWVIEALEGKGVRLVPLRCWYLWSGDVVAYRFDPKTIGSQQSQAVIDWAMRRVGLEYTSPVQFVRSFSFATRWLCRKLGVRVDLEVDRFHCSEFVSAAFLAAELEIPKEPAEMFPGDVVKLPFLRRIEG